MDNTDDNLPFRPIFLAEIIRMNRLIREEIDLKGFWDWYAELSDTEMCSLLTYLWMLALQARVRYDTFERAIEASQLSVEDPLIQPFRLAIEKSVNYYYFEGMPLEDWLILRSTEELARLLPFMVYLFGYAEQPRARACHNSLQCNHWWHRDLLNERVVQDLLDNPKYYSTRPKNDLAIKNPVQTDLS